MIARDVLIEDTNYSLGPYSDKINSKFKPVETRKSPRKRISAMCRERRSGTVNFPDCSNIYFYYYLESVWEKMRRPKAEICRK